MATELTARQAQVLGLIEQLLEQTGFPPTRAELARTLGFKSTNAAEDHLRALARKGYIELKAGASRGIKLIQHNPAHHSDQTEIVAQSVQASTAPAASIVSYARSNHNQTTLPLIGRVAAGSPILAQENVAKELAVDSSLFSSRPDYLLQVRGMSMRDIGILDGDLLAVKKTSEARAGEIVVARIDDDVTVKRLSREKGKIVLLPENPDFEPIHIRPGEVFAIEGLAVGLIRTQPLH